MTRVSLSVTLAMVVKETREEPKEEREHAKAALDRAPSRARPHLRIVAGEQAS